MLLVFFKAHISFLSSLFFFVVLCSYKDSNLGLGANLSEAWGRRGGK